ncbi:DUF3575 domain-containing protein [Pontimicrobium sp. SW4]|uniref:DUF3575 domain-containing protein n=1 Tax=Pontimicrobium sp. SW4 TaxID=3153519 RepID=A0AAU7BT22_9FLAO
MKKPILLLTLLCTIMSFSQEVNDNFDTSKRDELKLNMTNLIGFKWLDVGYERIINEESSFGVGTLISLGDDYDTGLDEYRTFSITPYYRHFFSKKYAQGFFVEAFGMLHSGKEETYVYYDELPNVYGEYNEDNYTDFAVGISAGAKFVTKRGFIAEIYLGIGRDLLGNSDIEVVGRGGIAIGYRF